MIEKKEKIGKVHIYTGNGKGKTTSSLGLAVRAAGNGMKVFIGQFMKGEEYSEIKALAKFDNIEVEQFGWPKCIRKEEVTSFHKHKTIEGFDKCKDKILSGNYDLVIMDEIIVSIWFGLIREEDVLEFLNSYSGKCEIVMTGRYASEIMIKRADLVTEMKCIKHYYDQGVLSRKGIEN